VKTRREKLLVGRTHNVSPTYTVTAEALPMTADDA